MTALEALTAQLLPPDCCERILVLKAGSGSSTVLAASRQADFVVAVEPSPRLCEQLMAQCKQHGIENVIIRPGVEDRLRYPRIVIPWLEDEGIEASLQPRRPGTKSHIRLVTKALNHLAPGGRLYTGITAAFHSQTREAKQIFEWIPAAEAHDCALFEIRELSTVEFAIAQVRRGNPLATTLDQWMALLDQSGSRRIVNAFLVLQKSENPPFCFLQHEVLPDPPDLPAVHRNLDWWTSCQREEFDHVLLASRPMLTTNWCIRQTYAVEDGQLVGGRQSLATKAPFQTDHPFPPWLPQMLERIDGQRSASEIFAFLEQSQLVRRHDFLYAMKLLGSHEVIRVS